MLLISESCAQEVLKSATPLQRAEEVAVAEAMAAVTELRQFNETYSRNCELEDNFDVVIAKPARPDEDVVIALSKYYLLLLHRRGLVA